MGSGLMGSGTYGADGPAGQRYGVRGPMGSGSIWGFGPYGAVLWGQALWGLGPYGVRVPMGQSCGVKR